MTDARVDAPIEPLTGKIALLRGFLRMRSDPDRFIASLAHQAIEVVPFPMDGRRLLDLGCGRGELARELARRGHDVVSTDLDLDELRTGRPPRPLQSDAAELPIRSSSIDGVVCSNVLEHTPRPHLLISEVARVVRPGGWAWLSWTPWWTPFGGHAIAPFHYLGADRGLRAYRSLFGEPRGRNLPYDGVWPSTVAAMIDAVERQPGVELLDAFPRYYPSQRWLMKLRRVREVAVWNCVLLVRRTDSSGR